MKLKQIFFFILPISFLILSCQNKNVNPLSPGTDFVSAPIFLKQWGATGPSNGQFGQVGDLTLDSSGNVYTCDVTNNRVEKFDSNGNYLAQWGGPVTSAGAGQFNNPAAVASFATSLYVADSGNNRIESFDDNGDYGRSWGGGGSGVSQLSNPQALALDTNSNIYVADTGNNRIEVFYSAASIPPLIWGSAGTGPASFESPKGIALDSSKNVYVADTLNNRIQKFSPTGTFLKQWGSYGTSLGQFRSPEGIAFDSLGNLYVSDAGNARIQEFDTSGDFLSSWGGQGDNLGQFQVPISLAITQPPYFFYIADFGTNYVKKYGTPVTYSIFPNPVLPGEDLTISFNSASYIGFLIQIVDFNNNVVFSDQGQAVAGNNAIQWDTTSGGSRVPAGVYLLSLTLGHSSVNEKISVAN
jgi:tripartite motif-containing protein 71